MSNLTVFSFSLLIVLLMDSTLEACEENAEGRIEDLSSIDFFNKDTVCSANTNPAEDKTKA